MSTPILSRLLKTMFSAPRILIAYAFFAVTVVIAEYLILPLTSDHIQELLVPYTGWLASMYYSFTIFFALAMIFQEDARRRIRASITGILVLQIVFGLLEISRMGGENFGNPYLTISPWRPIWTVLIPLAWIMALYHPSINRYCNLDQAQQEA